MNGYSTYLNTVIKISVKTARSDKRKYSKELDEVFKNHFFDLGGPTTLKRELTKNEIVTSKLFYGFIEIHRSYERLKDHEIYISSFPYSRSSLSRVGHLSYNVENYLNEFYILKERTKAYLTTVGRIYKNDKRHSDILKHTKIMFNAIPQVFDDLIQARGSHVHQRRYTDSDFDRLTTMELLSVHGGDDFEMLSVLYNVEYKKLRKKWKEIIMNKNKSLLKVLDLIFETLHPHIFTKSGNIRFPHANKIA